MSGFCSVYNLCIFIGHHPFRHGKGLRRMEPMSGHEVDRKIYVLVVQRSGAHRSSFSKRPLDVRDFEGHVAMLGGHCTWLDSFHEGERNFWIRFMKRTIDCWI
ncbi:hypothetical protein P8452_09966 [Trifolium repens]|nr:hypothetical protein P8452_09966 [Trifolium repens]